MTVTREDTAEYLDTQYSALAASVGQDADLPTGYAPDIDLALRKLGVARAALATATVEDSQEEALFTLAEYYAARRLWRLLGDRVNHTMNTTTFNFDGQRKQAKEMMDDAAARVAALGYDVTGSAWSVGYLNEDWLEPELRL